MGVYPALRGSLPHKRVKPTQQLEVVSFDLMGPYPRTSRGKTNILVATDCHSRWVEAYPLGAATAAVITQTLERELFARFGYPRVLLSDNGPQFTSNVWKKAFDRWGVEGWTKALDRWGVEGWTTPVYHPRVNPVQRRNQELKKSLRALLVNDSHRSWDQKLFSVLFTLRNQKNDRTGVSPYVSVFGHETKSPGDWALIVRSDSLPRVLATSDINTVADKSKENQRAFSAGDQVFVNLTWGLQRSRQSETRAHEVILVPQSAKSCEKQKKSGITVAHRNMCGGTATNFISREGEEALAGRDNRWWPSRGHMRSSLEDLVWQTTSQLDILRQTRTTLIGLGAEFPPDTPQGLSVQQIDDMDTAELRADPPSPPAPTDRRPIPGPVRHAQRTVREATTAPTAKPPPRPARQPRPAREQPGPVTTGALQPAYRPPSQQQRRKPPTTQPLPQPTAVQSRTRPQTAPPRTQPPTVQPTGAPRPRPPATPAIGPGPQLSIRSRHPETPVDAMPREGPPTVDEDTRQSPLPTFVSHEPMKVGDDATSPTSRPYTGSSQIKRETGRVDTVVSHEYRDLTRYTPMPRYHHSFNNQSGSSSD
ncbi:Pro-Pol polyprotein [Aphis craccivora]|uniref:Pro-Pol polyprotein n=1 Tax=Aphis craccivora TaxID=307492 RepID=A0A6G0X0A0_APHCR|nr:Pro-Pol polyprotein [Aphis craccivora]